MHEIDVSSSGPMAWSCYCVDPITRRTVSEPYCAQLKESHLHVEEYTFTSLGSGIVSQVKGYEKIPFIQLFV